ncbi:Protein-L-isoaspartate O-methyltransferase [Anatilimnocola aggregata]|uniref:Protein-L-isoaspartate O-methyltransferase n=1 Tax=Anatilimnocola aggregata TaxID=2528021 RepID=A0A517YLZ9_9BACT|nr:protein-L-isoaspartate(D-aspartate) O-methyltransferase [Anatilimnocola aggregata]QDU31241.1 Protein-L-isoaspartate O-methyltransferase [Anatilimnocola aggregata]
MTFSHTSREVAKQQMLHQHLRARGIADERVLAAMALVPREQFVPENEAQRAYADEALAIDCGQTISQPYMVALMTQTLELLGHERVLEIGTGSGYQTAILAELGAEVYSLERHAHLSEQAGVRLRTLGYTNVHLRVGDGSLGWPEAAPFERIILTAAARHCPPALWQQLAENGLLIGPFGPTDQQILTIIRKIDGRAELQPSIGCRFVPLVAD